MLSFDNSQRLLESKIYHANYLNSEWNAPRSETKWHLCDGETQYIEYSCVGGVEWLR